MVSGCLIGMHHILHHTRTLVVVTQWLGQPHGHVAITLTCDRFMHAHAQGVLGQVVLQVQAR